MKTSIELNDRVMDRNGGIHLIDHIVSGLLEDIKEEHRSSIDREIASLLCNEEWCKRNKIDANGYSRAVYVYFKERQPEFIEKHMHKMENERDNGENGVNYLFEYDTHILGYLIVHGNHNSFTGQLKSKLEERFWCEKYNLDENTFDCLRTMKGRIRLFEEKYPHEAKEIREKIKKNKRKN
jgi:hypothetical protein